MGSIDRLACPIRNLHSTQSLLTSQFVSCTKQSIRYGSGRGPNVCLLPTRSGRGTDQQLALARSHARDAARKIFGLHAWTNHVRGPLLYGAAGKSVGSGRYSVDGLPLRGGEHAYHVPHGQRCPEETGQLRKLHPLHAQHWRSARTRSSRRSMAMQ